MSHQTFIELFNKGKESLSQWRPQTKIMSEATFDVIDFFCCGGGMSLGFASLRESFRILGGADDFEVLLRAYGGGFTRGAHGYNAIHTTGNLGFNQCLVGIIIHLTILERGNNSCIKSLVFHNSGVFLSRILYRLTAKSHAFFACPPHAFVKNAPQRGGCGAGMGWRCTMLRPCGRGHRLPRRPRGN